MDDKTRTIIVTPTCRKYEKYCQAGCGLFDKLWPEHPQQWIITDGDLQSDHVIQTQGNWVEMLKDGLRTIEERMGVAPDYVLFILEDLLPLRSVNVEEVQNTLQIMQTHGVKYVTFPTYPCRWKVDSGGKFATFKGYRFTVGGEQFGETVLHRMNPKLRWYSQTQPALWEWNHLKATVQAASDSGRTSAWEYEFYRTETPHYISEYQWPSIWNGWFVEGKVNLPVFFHLSGPDKSELRGLLSECAWKNMPDICWNIVSSFPKKIIRASKFRLKQLVHFIRWGNVPWEN